MKRIKPYVFALLVIMTVMCLSACGRSDNNVNDTSGSSESATNQTTTSAGTMESTTRSVNDTRNADEYNQESTGVIDGVIHDVEKGVDDMTGESNGHPTDAATETTMAR